jgi:predicted AlkP superfamily pyrophosphatase or phosphodiesterase
MKKLALLIGLFFLLSIDAYSQPRPKLVIGIVVDQMRWDYLYRYQSRYTPHGFKRLLGEGFSCENTFIPYTPTTTAAGHTCVYTGSVPSLHGIMGNSWYSKTLKRTINCVDDDSVRPVGSGSAAGKMSPKNLWSNTITDELNLAQNFQSKTISIALKDRGAILPGGHTANAAYWFDNNTGGWITSTYYRADLPAWIQKMNAAKLPAAALKKNWEPLYAANSYAQSAADNNDYEGKIPGGGNIFPYHTDTITRNSFETFRYLPAANTFVFETGKAAIENEGLGAGQTTDFLALSFSSTDYVGHTFGPNSREAEDMYLRFDRDLGDFLAYLDKRLGKGQYLLFLTADHGVAHISGFNEEHQLPGGVLNGTAIRSALNASLQQVFGATPLVASFSNYQVYLNDSLLKAKQLDRDAVKKVIIESLLATEGVAKAIDLEKIMITPLPARLQQMLSNGYNQKLSGDIQLIPLPQWYSGGTTGASHGVWNAYDAHIPLVWFGWKIKHGKTTRETYMYDIAPTLAALLQIQMPNSSIGNVISVVAGEVPARGAVRK